MMCRQGSASVQRRCPSSSSLLSSSWKDRRRLRPTWHNDGPDFFTDCYLASFPALETPQITPPAVLHHSGFATEWCESMAVRSRTSLAHAEYEGLRGDEAHDISFAEDPELLSLLQFHSTDDKGLRSLHHEYQARRSLDWPSDGVTAQLQSPFVLQAKAPLRHTPDLQHYLRSSRFANVANPQEPSSSAFPVLLDTGCSVSCSGYRSDFRGELVMGDFGVVKTANGEAKIQGFGMVQWDVVSDMGELVTIVCPAYYSSAIEMRLLSPQDYARYHKQDASKPSFSGSSAWMHLHSCGTTFQAWYASPGFCTYRPWFTAPIHSC